MREGEKDLCDSNERTGHWGPQSNQQEECSARCHQSERRGRRRIRQPHYRVVKERNGHSRPQENEPDSGQALRKCGEEPLHE
jgi:hypothetical protein